MECKPESTPGSTIVTGEWTSINSQSLIYAVKQNLGISMLPKILVEEEIARGEIYEIKVNDFDFQSSLTDKSMREV